MLHLSPNKLNNLVSGDNWRPGGIIDTIVNSFSASLFTTKFNTKN